MTKSLGQAKSGLSATTSLKVGQGHNGTQRRKPVRQEVDSAAPPKVFRINRPDHRNPNNPDSQGVPS